MMHNNLFLNRLIIYTRQNLIAYDEKYHRGINIIRGDNSSGKSTISHFIFYVLGGSFNDWVKEAKKCAYVVAEVEMNGAVLTIKREINISPETNKGNASEPLYVFWGNIEASTESGNNNNWLKFSYNTTDNKNSFSNLFFDTLEIPIVKGENNITFHQILRLLYVDQESPTSSLFLYEQFDTTLTRETVSDLLLGIYNQDLYDAKQRQLDASNEFENVKREIKVIKQFIRNDLDLFPEHIRTQIENKQKEIAKNEEEILLLKETNKIVRYGKTTKLEFEKLNEEAIKQRQTVQQLENEISALKYELEDSKYFILSLENKKKAVRNSILTREFLGGFPLEYCPECLSEIHSSNDHSICKLCKEPVDQSSGITQARKIEQDINFQIKESTKLLSKKERILLERVSRYELEKENLHLVQSKVNAALKDVKSLRDERIDTLYGDKGFLEGEILQYNTLLENAELYQSLISKKNSLENEIEFLKASIEKMRNDQESKRTKVNRAIEKEALIILNNDLKRQDDFIQAKEFHIDFRNNIAFISDKDAKYSASSNFYLKTAARFAIFLASLEIDDMRYPRFILCDNMEDKGIEEKRAQNFQRIIISESQKHDKVDYQVIYTTSFIPEELDNTTYCVGEFYTKDSPSLKNVPQ